MRRIGMVFLLVASALVGSHTSAEADEPYTVSIFSTSSNEANRLDHPERHCGRPPAFWPWGYTGPCLLVFPVVVSPYPSEPVEVTVAFSYVSADAGDVVELPDPITLTYPGSSSDCACVALADDALSETDETLIATITQVSGAVVGEGTATGTIHDDDPAAQAPDAAVVASGTSSVTLGWSPVAPVRGALAGYTISAMDDATGSVVAQQSLAADVGRTSVAGLDADRSYTFEVRADTTEGRGAAATVAGAPDASGATPALPGAPSVVGLTAGDGFVTVEWAPSADDGGAPILAYSLVALRSDDSSLVAWRNLDAQARTASLSGLANGTELDVHVVAWNAVGPATTAAVSPIPDPSGGPAQAPAAVPAIEVGSSNGTAAVSWRTAPERGLPVLGYSVVVSEHVGDRPVHLVEWRNVGPDVRSATFTGLSLCHYDVHVIAHGATGFGDVAASLDRPIQPVPMVNDGRHFCDQPPEE